MPPSKIDVVKGTKVMTVGIRNQPHARKRQEKRDAGEEKAALRAIRNALNKDRIYARVPQSQKQNPGDDDTSRPMKTVVSKTIVSSLPHIMEAPYSLKPDMAHCANQR